MAGVLMTSLKYYYLATGDEEVAGRIVKIANWLVENLYDREADGFRYTACPHTGVSASSSMIMGNGLAFAANYSGDEDLMKLTRRTFVRGFLAFSGGAHGKTIAYATCAAPLAIHEISRFPGPALDELHGEMVEAAHDPARRRLPSIVPNPDFERDLSGWRVRAGLALSHNTEIAHTGTGSAMAEGTIEGQNEYFVTHYACGPPWEITWLEPGEDYRLQLWLRVDEFEGKPAPTARISTRSKGVTRGSFETGEYDLARLGQWQLLQTEFTAPEDTDAAYIAVNTRDHDPKTVRMYLDDVAVVPVGEEPRETYVWATGEATEAALSGGVAVVAEGIMDGWDVLAAPEGAAGEATFTLELSQEDDYVLLLRAQLAGEGAAALPVLLNGEPAGEARVADDGWTWLAVGDRRRLPAGEHTVTVRFPRDADVMLHSVLLTNR
jgi:hypothetical protein